MFITFEGIEGCGKSTQARLLAELLSARGSDVLSIHEPGGTVAGDAIRKILLSSSTGALDPVTELLLFSAARRELVTSTINPALKKGKVVICDRFYDSTITYQGYARGVDLEMIRQCIQIAAGDLAPDLTIILDLPAEKGLDRAMGRMIRQKQPEIRFEEEGLGFHKKVRDGFLSIAREEPARVKVINAEGTVEEVHARVSRLLDDLLPQT